MVNMVVMSAVRNIFKYTFCFCRVMMLLVTEKGQSRKEIGYIRTYLLVLITKDSVQCHAHLIPNVQQQIFSLLQYKLWKTP